MNTNDNNRHDPREAAFDARLDAALRRLAEREGEAVIAENERLRSEVQPASDELWARIKRSMQREKRRAHRKRAAKSALRFAVQAVAAAAAVLAVGIALRTPSGETWLKYSTDIADIAEVTEASDAADTVDAADIADEGTAIEPHTDAESADEGVSVGGSDAAGEFTTPLWLPYSREVTDSGRDTAHHTHETAAVEEADVSPNVGVGINTANLEFYA